MGLKSAGDHDVFARWQPEAVGYLSQVDERSAPGLGGVVPEEVFLQVFLSFRALRWERKGVGSQGRLLLWAI